MNRVSLFITKMPLAAGREFHVFAPADVENDLPKGFTPIREDPKVQIFEDSIVVIYRCERKDSEEESFYPGSDISKV